MRHFEGMHKTLRFPTSKLRRMSLLCVCHSTPRPCVPGDSRDLHRLCTCYFCTPPASYNQVPNLKGKSFVQAPVKTRKNPCKFPPTRIRTHAPQVRILTTAALSPQDKIDWLVSLRACMIHPGVYNCKIIGL